jgi:hypothetical protein
MYRSNSTSRTGSPRNRRGSAAPAVETSFYWKNAVELGGCERNRDAPEEGNKGEKHDGHAGAGIVEDAFVTERAAGSVAVKKREKGEEANLAEV